MRVRPDTGGATAASSRRPSPSRQLRSHPLPVDHSGDAVVDPQTKANEPADADRRPTASAPIACGRGRRVTNGLDCTIDFSYPLFDGTLSARLRATQNLVYEHRGFTVNGFVFEEGGNRLGYANYTRTGNESRRWRGNATVRWANDTHSISLRANYNSGIYNEAFDSGDLTPIINNTGNVPDVYSTFGINRKDYLDFDVTYIYTAPFWEELELRLTVENIFDQDPTPAQGRSGYYNGTGDPRGRIVEVGVTKKF